MWFRVVLSPPHRFDRWCILLANIRFRESLRRPERSTHQPTGKEVRRSAHTAFKSTAQQFLARLLDEHHRLDRGGRPRRTYKEALVRFTVAHPPTLKPRTQEQYRTSIRQLNDAFGGLYLDEITRARLADFASHGMTTGAKGATVCRDLAMLSCVCSCAVAWDYVEASRVAIPRAAHPTIVTANDIPYRRTG